MQGIREFLNSDKGKYAAVGLTAVVVLVAAFVAYQSLGPSDAMAASRGRVFIDAETGETFTHEITAGETSPVDAPSGKKTGYEAEPCFWTADGQVKDDPTYVLMNRHAGKDGPTFCPDCGRLVTDLNPPPIAGAKPPPTEAEYAARRGRRPAGPQRGEQQ